MWHVLRRSLCQRAPKSGNIVTKQIKVAQKPKNSNLLKSQKRELLGDKRCVAFCSGDEFDALSVTSELKVLENDFGKPEKLDNCYRLESKDGSNEIFMFNDMGVIVGWNLKKDHLRGIVDSVRVFQESKYSNDFIDRESDEICYRETKTGVTTFDHGSVNFNFSSKHLTLEKAALSHSLALSVKLSRYEDLMEQLIKFIIFIPEDLKNGQNNRIGRSEVLKLSGEIECVRLAVNLNNEFLNIEQMYWDHDDVSKLFLDSCKYFNIKVRTDVLNEKLHHSHHIIDLLKSHLSEKHGHRLEWLIILLIWIEVVLSVLEMLIH